MPKGRIRVRLKSYDARVLDAVCQQILDSVIRTGAKVIGPVPLPTDRSTYAVNKSPFIDKDARDHFEIRQELLQLLSHLPLLPRLLFLLLLELFSLLLQLVVVLL